MYIKVFKFSYVCNIFFFVVLVKIMFCLCLMKCFIIDSDVFWFESWIVCYYNYCIFCGFNKVLCCYKILLENNIDGFRLFF